MSVHLRKQASALHSRLITLSLHVSAAALLIFLAATAGAGVVSADFFISALLRLLYRRIILIGKHLLRRFLLLYLCLDTHAVKNLQRILLKGDCSFPRTYHTPQIYILSEGLSVHKHAAQSPDASDPYHQYDPSISGQLRTRSITTRSSSRMRSSPSAWP